MTNTNTQGESVSEVFECIRGDIYLYEIAEIDYGTLVRGLRESVELLEARRVRAGGVTGRKEEGQKREPTPGGVGRSAGDA